MPHSVSARSSTSSSIAPYNSYIYANCHVDILDVRPVLVCSLLEEFLISCKDFDRFIVVVKT